MKFSLHELYKKKSQVIFTSLRLRILHSDSECEQHIWSSSLTNFKSECKLCMKYMLNTNRNLKLCFYNMLFLQRTLTWKSIFNSCDSNMKSSSE